MDSKEPSKSKKSPAPPNREHSGTANSPRSIRRTMEAEIEAHAKERRRHEPSVSSAMNKMTPQVK